MRFKFELSANGGTVPILVTTEATAVTSTPATMTRNPAIFASCPTTGLMTGLTSPNMARKAILRVPMRLMTE